MNFKNWSISSDQGVVQIEPNLAWSIPSVCRVQNRKNFWHSLPRKEVSFSYGNLLLLQINCNYWILKIGLFLRIKDLFQSNQTRHGVSPVYVESKTERIFGIACLGKKLVFHTEICYYFKQIILKIGLFRRVKELFKSNRTWYGVYHGCLESKRERNFGIACLVKS